MAESPSSTGTENPPSEEFKTMVENNLWHGDLLETVTELLKLAVDDEKGGYPTNPKGWSWVKNPKDVKYVTIRIDMRDGGFVILDRNKERISLEQIKYQFPSRS